MSDSEESGITYTAVSSPYEDLSDIGSPRADDHELLEPPYMLEDPYAEAALQATTLSRFCGLPRRSEGMTNEDPEEYPIEPFINSVDGGDDGDDEMDIEEDEDADMDIDEEDEDDEMDDEEAEEEHSAPAYPVVVALPATARLERCAIWTRLVAGHTTHLILAYRMTARISIPEPLPVPAWSDSEVARLLAISSPPASPLSPWSSSPPQIPLPVSPPPPVLTAPPPSPIRSLGYRAATIRMRAEAAATSHSLPLHPPFIYSPTPLNGGGDTPQMHHHP
ncbi:hypothetical protein Tco_0149474 [Tanacetum coccineum]